MLTSLSVQDLVVVRDAEIDFEPGLTVLTGETGAGKSVLIEALSLALGGRADSKAVRSGAKRATVTARFDLSSSPTAREFLAEQDLDHEPDDGEECMIRRVVGADGRSRAYCNANPVTLAVLRELAAHLIDIHAQHQGLRAQGNAEQRRLLDAYGGHEAELEQVHAAWARWRAASDQLAALEQESTDPARRELLRYQVDELERADIAPGEVEQIESEHRLLANVQTSQEHAGALEHALNDSDSGIVSMLNQAVSLAQSLAQSVPAAANVAAALEQARSIADDARADLDAVGASLESNPQRLQLIEQRLATLHELARKHQVSLEDLAALRDRLRHELGSSDQKDDDMTALRAAIEAEARAYQQAAEVLSRRRAQCATDMGADITERLHELAIPHARFDIALLAESDTAPHPGGAERIEFRVATNPSVTPGPLAKVASGGELARITLAIQAATARLTGVPVVVYDEVDAGIGGNTANIVGANLRAIAAHCQVICITHSPQVAGAGDQHVLVDKAVRDGLAETSLSRLNRRAREVEIARMLGATQSTASSLAHARDLLDAALDGVQTGE